MQEIPHPWGEYARLQAISAKTSKIDSISWGIEAEMDALLADSSNHTSRDARRLERLRKTIARRERSRAHLRKAHSTELATEPPNVTSQLEAREALQRIEAKVTSTQWAVITALGQGYSFA